jgi:primosomal protein N'
MSEKPKRYVVCIHNEESEHSLELRKIYEVLDDPVAAKHNMLRVIDEEDEDYLYPAAWFLPIELPHNLVEAFAELSH